MKWYRAVGAMLSSGLSPSRSVFQIPEVQETHHIPDKILFHFLFK
ncbi:hypothetical protein PDE_07620 [Penicillium oxalicum 114-2]|uniref:Uncharacterized protein n=1 Tax=Penicillium oxalicum (strain 114-2 / CGMCC 5302) TaxID=933388 RepID=S7ZPL5_PENO1|nr:hypothetical protein PDE_07620 [Penicillium oxalicum 114-2]